MNDSDSNSKRVNDKIALRKERDRRYRERHQEKINQRRRDKWRNRQNLQPIANCPDVPSIQPIQLDEVSSKQVNDKSALRRERNRRYREKHREKINQRRRDKWRNQQNLQPIASRSNVPSIQPKQLDEVSGKQVDKNTLRREGNLKYQRRHREEINQQRRENGQRKQNKQHIARAADIHSIDEMQQNTEEIADDQPSASCSNLNVIKEITQNFNSCLQHNTQLERATVCEPDLKRTHLVIKQDLYDIEKSFNSNSEADRNSADALSMDAWVGKEKLSKNDCALLYKPQGVISPTFPYLGQTDFALGCQIEENTSLDVKHCTRDCGEYSEENFQMDEDIDEKHPFLLQVNEIKSEEDISLDVKPILLQEENKEFNELKSAIIDRFFNIISKMNTIDELNIVKNSIENLVPTLNTAKIKREE